MGVAAAAAILAAAVGVAAAAAAAVTNSSGIGGSVSGGTDSNIRGCSNTSSITEQHRCRQDDHPAATLAIRVATCFVRCTMLFFVPALPDRPCLPPSALSPALITCINPCYEGLDPADEARALVARCCFKSPR